MKFIKDNALLIFVAFAVIVFLGVFFIPLGIRIAKDIWQWALYGTM